MWFRLIETFSNLCYRHQDFDEIISLCQEVLRFEDSEEYIHEIYMDALRKAGYRGDALKHYDMITALPGRGERFANSSRLKDLYRNIVREMEHNQLIDEDGLEQYFMEFSTDTGTIVRDKDIFLHHCYILRLHAERSTYMPYICIIETLDLDTDNRLYQKISDVTYLTNVVKNVFRRGDILCEWNDRQVLVLLACKQDFDAEELNRRIKQAIIRDNRESPDDASSHYDFTDSLRYLPLRIRIVPIREHKDRGENRERGGRRGETVGIGIYDEEEANNAAARTDAETETDSEAAARAGIGADTTDVDFGVDADTDSDAVGAVKK
jgi:GGDEF domain-containing protein